MKIILSTALVETVSVINLTIKHMDEATPDKNEMDQEVNNGDLGHELLIADLQIIFEEAENYEFHDFKNTKYPAPKIALDSKLREIQKNTIEGRYDN